MYEYGVLATPSAIDAGLLDEPYAQVMVRLDPAVPDAAEHVRNTAADIDPTSWVRTLQDIERDAAFSSVRTGILVGSTLTMLLVAASLLVATLEQLRDRKRLLSSLVAFGTRRSTLSWSVLWQTAIPIALGLVLAVAGGLGLGVVLLKMGGQRVQDWWVFLPVMRHRARSDRGRDAPEHAGPVAADAGGRAAHRVTRRADVRRVGAGTRSRGLREPAPVTRTGVSEYRGTSGSRADDPYRQPLHRAPQLLRQLLELGVPGRARPHREGDPPRGRRFREQPRPQGAVTGGLDGHGGARQQGHPEAMRPPAGPGWRARRRWW